MTKDIQRAILRACSQFILRKLEPLEKRLSDMETKAMTVEYDGVVKELLQTDGLAALVDLQVAASIAKHFEANPVRNGIDGKPGERGEPGQKGDPGADGVGLAGAIIDRDGNLIVTKTNGEQVPLGAVIGKDGAPGKDGADFSDVEFDYDGERGLIIRSRNGGEIVKRLPIPIDRGYWQDGKKAEQGDVMTCNGCVWVAIKDTSKKPCHENPDDWRLMVRKGRDGLQGPPGRDYQPPQPVKLNG